MAKRKLNPDKLLKDFVNERGLAPVQLDRNTSKRFKEAISNATSSDDGDLIMYSAVAFKSNVRTVKDFCEFFQRELENVQADDQSDDKPEEQRVQLEILPDTMDQHCNGILFVFDTNTPRKLALQIKSLKPDVDIFTLEQCELNFQLVNNQLRRQHKPVLPPGSIDDLGPTHAKLRLYVFQFDETQPCSKVFQTKVNLYEQPPYITNISTAVKRNVGWAFFSLIADPTYDVTNTFDESGRLKQPHIYKDPETEKERMDPLLQAIRLQYNLYTPDTGVEATMVSGQGDRLKYCQFTGGGDIHVQSKGKSLVICNTLEQDLSLSPVRETESVSSLVIEGKLYASKKRTLTHQLIANTILCCVEQFVAECRNKEHDETFLKQMTTLSGYSVPYTGEGYVGFYKLTMELNKQTTFRAMVRPGIYDRPISAAYVDYALEYFFGKINIQS